MTIVGKVVVSAIPFGCANETPGGRLRPNAQAHHFLVVFGFVGLGYLLAIGGVNATPAPAARVARTLARTHLGMAAADRRNLLLELDGRDRPILSAAGGANVNGTGRNRSCVKRVGDRWPVHRGYGT